MGYDSGNSKWHLQDRNMAEYGFILFPVQLKAINFVI